MKKLNTLLLSAIILCISCNKEGSARFQGSWSYKTSGTITYSIPEDVEDTATIALDNESGQMHIVKSSDSEMIVTMNALLGDVSTFEAIVSGNRIELKPQERIVPLTASGLAPDKAEVLVSGYGERYDDVLIFHLNYEGEAFSETERYEITASDVRCVATLNK